MKTLQVVVLMSFMVFGCAGVAAMGEPDITAHFKEDFVKYELKASIWPDEDNLNEKKYYTEKAIMEKNCLWYSVVHKLESLMCCSTDFDFDYINPRNSKSVDVYLRAWVPSNTIKATLQVAPKDGVDYSVFARVPKKFKECGIDCELEFIKYEDRKLD